MLGAGTTELRLQTAALRPFPAPTNGCNSPVNQTPCCLAVSRISDLLAGWKTDWSVTPTMEGWKSEGGATPAMVDWNQGGGTRPVEVDYKPDGGTTPVTMRSISDGEEC